MYSSCSRKKTNEARSPPVALARRARPAAAGPPSLAASPAPAGGRMSLRRLRAMIIKEFTQMRRDQATLRLVLIIPVMQLLIFGYAIRMDVRNLPLAVYDASHTQESRALVQRLEATGNFTVVRHEIGRAHV